MNPFSFIVRVLKFFSVYADPFEKKIDHFLKRLNQNSKRNLEELMQQDLVKLSIFLEYKFRGYKKLKKRFRRELYKNAALIAADYLQHFDQTRPQIVRAQKAMHLPGGLAADERMTYLLGIMDYLKPGKRLQYKESVTFQKLLRNPASEMLVGDCNQITTLYIYLYSLRYPITDLSVKILPEHVCLNYKGVDIETTNATLTEYPIYTFLGSADEIVAANLLDIPDPSEKQFEVSPVSMLKSAQVAFYFSSHRQTVEKNLLVAYHNMAVYYARQKDYKKAALFANKTGSTKLQAQITRIQAVEDLKTKRYEKALEGFRRINDAEGERACFQNELADLFEKIKPLKTIESFKGQATHLRRMKELALRLNNQKVVNFTTDLLNKL